MVGVVGTQLPDRDSPELIPDNVSGLQRERQRVIVTDHDPGVGIVEPGDQGSGVPKPGIGWDVVRSQVLVIVTARAPCPRCWPRVRLVEAVIVIGDTNPRGRWR